MIVPFNAKMKLGKNYLLCFLQHKSTMYAPFVLYSYMHKSKGKIRSSNKK